MLQQLIDVLAHRRRRSHGHRRTPPRPLLVAAAARTVGGRVHLVAAAGRVTGGRVNRHLRLATTGGRVIPFTRRTCRRGRQRRGHLFCPASQPPPGGHVYPEIRDAHHHQRYVKRTHGRVHHVTGVRGERARRVLIEHIRPVVPADERR